MKLNRCSRLLVLPGPHPIRPRFQINALLLLLFVALPVCAQKPDLYVQTNHANRIASLAFSPDGRTLASGSWDSTIKLWDVASGNQLRTLVGHSKEVHAVAFSPDGKTLASGSWDQTIRLWDPESGNLLRTCSGHRDRVETIAFSPDGKTLASGNSANYDKIRFWDVASGSEIHALANNSNGINAIVYSPDGKLFATASYNALALWDAATYTEIRSLNGHTDHISSIAFSPDSKMLVSGSWDKSIKLWDVNAGRELRTLSRLPVAVTSIALSHDGKTLAVGAQQAIGLWDLASETELRTLSLKEAGEEVSALAFSPRGTTLASGSKTGTHSNFLRFWETANGTEIRLLASMGKPVRDIAISPDGSRLASGGSHVRLWDLLRDNGPRTLAPLYDDLTALAFSADGKLLASLGKNKDRIDLWNVASGEVSRSLVGRSNLISALAFSRDGSQLASYSSIDESVVLWDIASGRQLRSIKVGPCGLDNRIVFSPDGKLLASGSPDNTINLWNVADGKRVRLLNGGPLFLNPSAVAFSPDGKLLAGAGYNTIKLWDVASGAEIHTLDHARQVRSLAFSPGGKLFVSGGDDHQIRLWDATSGALVQTLTGHAAGVNATAFSANGRLIISGSSDTTIKVWDAASGQELATLLSLDENGWLVVSANGLFDGTPAAWSDVIWRFDNKTSNFAPVEVFFNEFFYPGLLKEVFEGKHPVSGSARDISQIDRRQPAVKVSLQDPAAGGPSALKSASVPVRIEVVDNTEQKSGSPSSVTSGAKDLRLFRNGSLVKMWHGDVLKGLNSITLETTIPIVAGKNKLTAYVFNGDNVKSSDATLEVTGTDNIRRQGTAYILAVGINNYMNPQYSLKYAVADAEDFSAEVKRQQQLQQRYGQVEVISLSDGEATKANITQKLMQLATRVQPEDGVIIYFAGHGTAHGNQFYLIPHDLGYDGPREELDGTGLQTILDHSISDRELEKLFEAIDAGQLLLVIDACNSGQALEAEEKRRGPMNSKGLAQLAYEKGMYVLTAAQSYQAAQEAARFGHGFLTYALMEEGLKKGAADYEPKDGRVTLNEWLDYAAERVPRMQEENMLDALRGTGRDIPFLAGEIVKDPGQRSVQRPRIFYRRELESNPLVIGVVSSTLTQ